MYSEMNVDYDAHKSVEGEIDPIEYKILFACTTTIAVLL